MTLPARVALWCECVFCAAGAGAQPTSSAIDSSDLQYYIRYLASDALEGRLAGTEGNRKAAAFIAGLLEKYGVAPAGEHGGYYQDFDFVSSVRPGPGNSFRLAGTGVPGGRIVLRPDVDFRPLGFTIDTSVTGPLEFVGYGISAPDKGYDDYKGLDVKGKIVVALRFSPDGTDPHGELNPFSSFRNKARIARDKGAAGLIIVTGPVDDPEDQLIKLSYDQSFASSGIAAACIRRGVVDSLLTGTGWALRSIQDSIRSGRKPVTFAFPQVQAELRTDVVEVHSTTANILGKLEGTDLELKDQVLVLGAHMDHLGYGGPGSGSLAPDTVAIHHGADDNASGTAGLLELAQAFAAHRSLLRRSLLFTFFSAEEEGDLGSAYYAAHPVVPLARTIGMINMDMIGRMSDRVLTVYGTGTSPEWLSLLHGYNRDSTFVLKEVADGYGPSDQASFYAKDVPVLFFFTGLESDYHRPSDTWEKINYPGEEQVVRYVYNVSLAADTLREKPSFVRVATSAPTGGGDTRGFTVTLGIIPDYAAPGEGMKIGGIRPKGPAEKAGLRSGDVIVKMAGRKVMNIYDYMAVLGELKVGDVVEVVAMREGKPVTVKATMDRRR